MLFALESGDEPFSAGGEHFSLETNTLVLEMNGQEHFSAGDECVEMCIRTSATHGLPLATSKQSFCRDNRYSPRKTVQTSISYIYAIDLSAVLNTL